MPLAVLVLLPCALAFPPRVVAGGLSLSETSLELAYSHLPKGESWSPDLEQGWLRSRGVELTLRTGVELRHGPWRATAGWQGRWGEALPARGKFQEGWLGWHGRHLCFTVGRLPVSWAPALEADLLISHHPPSLDQVRIQAASGALPIMGGRLSAENLLGYLDDPDRTVPYPLLWGMRVGWGPWDGIRIEAQRTIMLGGGNRGKRLTPRDVWEIFWGQGEGSRPDDTAPERFSHRETDQKFAWQGMLHPPPRQPWRLGMQDIEVFGIYAGEDRFNGLAPMARGLALGIRVHPTIHSAATFTYASTVDDYNIWYQHKIYADGYTYRGFLLGHPMGGDARSWRGGLFLATAQGVRCALRVIGEQRGYFRDGRGVSAGGHWRWLLEVSAPGPGVHFKTVLGGSSAWEGDLEGGRLAEGFASVQVTWGVPEDCAIVDREFVWGGGPDPWDSWPGSGGDD